MMFRESFQKIRHFPKIAIVQCNLSEPLTIEQQCENGATIIPHPSECQLYYNCSLRYRDVPRYFEQHMQECSYPQLFNTETKKCEAFENVDCGQRKETTDGCKSYMFFTFYSSVAFLRKYCMIPLIIPSKIPITFLKNRICQVKIILLFILYSHYSSKKKDTTYWSVQKLL